MTLLTRRSILCGILAAPIVVRSGILMPVRPVVSTSLLNGDLVLDGDAWMKDWPRIIGVCRVIVAGEPVVYTSSLYGAAKVILEIGERHGLSNAPS